MFWLALEAELEHEALLKMFHWTHQNDWQQNYANFQLGFVFSENIFVEIVTFVIKEIS